MSVHAAATQGYIQTSLIWVTYAVALALLFIIASTFVYIYQKPRDRAASVTIVCVITLLSLLATVLLLPVDVALVSSTVRSSEGRRKDWATQDRIDGTIHTLKIVYYTLYAWDAFLCLIVVPFTYFFYEEYDEVEAEEGRQGVGNRLLGALKYTIFFVVIAAVLFVAGFFVPINNRDETKHKGLDYLKNLLLNENRAERALTFGIGALITIGTFIYALYTGAGLALLPVAMIKTAPAISAPDLAATTNSELDRNRERQAQLEARNEGREGGLDPRDRRELEALLRDERTLVRRERLAAENMGENQHVLLRAWHKTEAVFRPLKLLGGMLLMVVALIIWVSMLITGIDKAKNSICKAQCGYILAHVEIFQPVNYIFTLAAKVFPIDYAVFLLLVLFLFASSVVGIAVIGIRFLWLQLFSIRKGHTSPQAMLLATILLALITLALNYAITMMIAPQYATYGPQTFCDRPTLPNEQPDCSSHRNSIKPCTEVPLNPVAKDVCTPSVNSNFLNRVNINFPFFGVVNFWAQFAFLGIYLIVGFTTLIRTPKVGDGLDADLEDEEEEGLLSSTGRRFNAAWSDVTGKARKANPAPRPDDED